MSASPMTPSVADRAIVTGSPACPRCAGRMWDNRTSKRNPKAPDFKCRDSRCDGALWPGQHSAAEPIVAPRSIGGESIAKQSGERDAPHVAAATPNEGKPSPRVTYLDVTRFALAEVRPLYRAAGVPCSDATVAAIVATLFIATCRGGGVRGAA